MLTQAALDYVAATVDDVAHSQFNLTTNLLIHLPSHVDLIMSPVGLGLLLFALRIGAHRRTARQIENVLRIPQLQYDDMDPYRIGLFNMLTTIRQKPTPYSTVKLGTRLYVRKGFPIGKRFRRLYHKTLDTDIQRLRLLHAKEAADDINEWVGNLTQGTVTSMIDPSSINSDTQMLLINVIYFKAPWKYPFDIRDTRATTFFLDDGTLRNVAMMHATDNFGYGYLPTIRADLAVLPYKGDRYSMHILVPQAEQTLHNMLQDMTNLNLDTLRSNIIRSGNCNKASVYLPRFSIESTHELRPVFQSMGMSDMFSSSRADFSGIPRHGRTVPGLAVSRIIQKAYINVTEEGTEASATTEIRAGVTCMPRLTIINANRPFYYHIIDEDTGALLFAGVVRAPEPYVDVERVDVYEDLSYEYEYALIA